MNTTLIRPPDPASPAGRRLRLVCIARRALTRFEEAADTLSALRRRRRVRRDRLESAIARVEHRFDRYKRLETVLAAESGLSSEQVMTTLYRSWPKVYRLLDSGLQHRSQSRPVFPRPGRTIKRTHTEGSISPRSQLVLNVQNLPRNGRT